MERDWRDDFTGAMLDFQEFIAGKWGDENKIADYLLETVTRLCGAEWGVLRKRKGESCFILAHRCLKSYACDHVNLKDDIISQLQQNHIVSPLGDLERLHGILPEPIILDCYELPVKNYMFIKSTARGKDAREITLLNLYESCCSREFLRAVECLLNVMVREEHISHLNNNLIQKEKEIVRIIDSKTQFLGSLSHEIRSPLNGIVCMGSLLRETELNKDQEDLLNTIQFSADNITRIIQDLVELTMLSSGKVVLKNETFSLNAFSNSLVKNLRKDANSKGLTLNITIEKDLDIFHGDQVRLGQILSNLLQNAIKYTKEGEILLEIRSSGKGIEFVVSDTGIGIPKDKQDIIFEEFIQLERNSQRRGEYKGVGLGLAIVKDLVTMMGGSITVRSQEGKGSSFKFLLPQTNDNILIPVKQTLDTLSSPQELRFLVVDDDEINRLFLRTILERQGAVIDEAENGLLAVQLASKNSYDMILMDISMPVMNGLDATEQIRKIRKDLPILAVTANAFEEDFKRILNAGLDDIILKPVNEKQLMDKVSTWLDRKSRMKSVNKD